MVLKCYLENKKPIWVGPDGREWRFHPTHKVSSLSGGLGAFRIGEPNNNSFMNRLDEKFPSDIAKMQVQRQNLVKFGPPREFDVPNRDRYIVPTVKNDLPKQVHFPRIEQDAMPLPTRGNQPNHRTYGANLSNEDSLVNLAVQADPEKDKGIFLPSTRKISLPQSAIVPSSAQQNSQDGRQGNFANDILDRFKNGDVDITKTVTDIKTIVDAFKGDKGNSGVHNTPVYIPVDRGTTSGGNVSEKNNNMLLIAAIAGIGLVGASIILSDSK